LSKTQTSIYLRKRRIKIIIIKEGSWV